MSGPRILTLDIETSPALCWSFQMWNANISPVQIVSPTRMISFAAKWRHENGVHFYSEFHNTSQAMVEKAHQLIDNADVLVTYNGDKFDIPHLGREFALLGLKPPSPYVSVDLYKVVKKNQLWLSHKLGYITEQLKLTGKLEHQGFQLWLDCMANDTKAWNTMRRYNKQDVVTTEELLNLCLPHITNMPSPALFDDELPLNACPVCGSTSFQRRGHARTKTRRYPRFHCQDCGKWYRGTRSELGVTAT
jgi:DNA polymerase elongation subunit (family B)